MTKLAQLQTEIEERAQKVNDLFDEEDTKGADHRETIETLNREIEDLEKRALDAKQHEGRRALNDQRLVRLTAPGGNPPMPGANGGPTGGGARMPEQAAKSLGAHFVESEMWQAFVKAAAPGGRFADGQHVQTPALAVPDLNLKTLITGAGATSGGAFTVADQSGIYDPLGRRPVSLRSIVTVRQTTSDAVEYVRQLARVNAAAPVAEATATAGASGTKPEGGFTFERVQELVRTIAEWVPATKRALADAAQLRGIIDDELRADLAEQVDWQILNGNGTGKNFTGLIATPGTQDQAFDTNILTTTRKGRTKVVVPGRSVPTAYVMHPIDWEGIDLAQDNEARYYFGGPMVVGTPRLWGLPVVETEAATQGISWVGEWRRVVLWDREQSTISVSDSHADFFIRNLVAILGELRATMGVIRPAAFVECDLTA